MISDEKSKSIKPSLKLNPKLSGSPQTANTMETCFKKMIRKTNSIRVDNGNFTTGRNKRVQFNTLPELSRPKNENSQILNTSKSIFKSKQNYAYKESEKLDHTSSKIGECEKSYFITENENQLNQSCFLKIYLSN